MSARAPRRSRAALGLLRHEESAEPNHIDYQAARPEAADMDASLLARPRAYRPNVHNPDHSYRWPKMASCRDG